MESYYKISIGYSSHLHHFECKFSHLGQIKFLSTNFVLRNHFDASDLTESRQKLMFNKSKSVQATLSQRFKIDHPDPFSMESRSLKCLWIWDASLYFCNQSGCFGFDIHYLDMPHNLHSRWTCEVPGAIDSLSLSCTINILELLQEAICCVFSHRMNGVRTLSLLSIL